MYEIAYLTKDKKFIKKVSNKIGRLVKKITKIKSNEFEKIGTPFYDVFEVISELKVSNDKEKNYHNRMVSVMQSAARKREELELYGNTYLRKGLHIVFLVLSILFIFLLITSIKDIITLIFSSAISFVVIFMYRNLIYMDRVKYDEYKIRTINIEDLEKLIFRKVR